jgi:hypothetical protein
MAPPRLDNKTSLAAQPRMLMGKDGERLDLCLTGVEVRYNHAWGGW